MSYAPTGFRVDLEVSGSWTNVTSYVFSLTGVSLRFGRTSPLNSPQVASASFALNNADGRFTPLNAGSSYYPAFAPRARVRVSYNSGSTPRFVGYIKTLTAGVVGGTLPVIQVEAVCRLSQLGTTIVGYAYAATIDVDNPIVHYALADPAGSPYATDSLGVGNPPLLKSGATAPTFGVTPTDRVDGQPMTQFNAATGYLVASSVPVVTAMSSAQGTIEAVFENITTTDTLAVSVGQMTLRWDGATALAGMAGQLTAFSSGGTYTGPVHVAVTWTWTPNTGSMTVYVNGVNAGSSSGPVIGFTSMGNPATVIAGYNTTGLISNVAVYSTALSAARIAAHSSAVFGWPGDVSGTRITRLLGMSGLTSSDWNVQAGQETLGGQSTADKSVLSLVDEVTTTEGGGAVLFADVDGRVRYNDASYRTASTPVLTLDAQVDLPMGTWAPFFDDLTRITRSTVTSDVATATYTSAAVTTLGLVSEQVTSISSDPSNPQRLAAYRVNTSATQTRFPQLVVDLARTVNYSTLFTALTNITIGSRIRVSNIPKSFTSVATGGSAVRIFPRDTIDLFVEGWSEQVADDTYRLTFDVSPADVPGARGVWTGGVSVDATSTAPASAGASRTTMTWAHTVTTGASLLCVAVTYAGGGSVTTSSVTWNGVALTGRTRVQSSSNANNRLVDLWYIVNPAPGTANIVVTQSGSNDCDAAAISWFGTDTVTPFGTAVTSGAATGTSISLTPSGGAYVLSAAAVRSTATLTVGGSPTTVLRRVTGAFNNESNVITYAPVTYNPSFSWATGTDENAAFAIPINAASVTSNSTWAPDTFALHTTVNNSATSWSVDVSPILSTSAGDYPQNIQIDQEIVTVTACSGASSPQTLTVTRAQGGTFADAHTSGATILLSPGSYWTM